MRVGPVCSRIRGAEPVFEAGTGPDGAAGRFGTIHIVAQGNAMPVHRRRVIEAIVDGDRNLVPPDIGPNQRTGNLVVVGQGARLGAAEVDVGRPPGIKRAVTVLPVCGRAASAAVMASDMLGLLGAPAGVERLHATNAAPPRTLAARNPRRVRVAGVRGPWTHHQSRL